MSKTILITGASTGIGRATAVYFAERGWNVAATMREPAKADTVLQRSNIFVTELDVTSDASIAGAVEATRSRFGQIDVLLNNAGYGLVGALEAMSPEQIDRQLRTNVYGLIRATQKVLPAMRHQGHGVIINIASIGGLVAFPYFSAYHATKFAVEGLSQSLRYELAAFNIRIKVVEPGGIATDFGSRSLVVATDDVYRRSTDAMMSFMKKISRSLPGPEHVAKVIYQAATDGSNRLHYLAKPGPFIYLHRLLPDGALRWLLSRALKMS